MYLIAANYLLSNAGIMPDRPFDKIINQIIFQGAAAALNRIPSEASRSVVSINSVRRCIGINIRV